MSQLLLGVIMSYPFGVVRSRHETILGITRFALKSRKKSVISIICSCNLLFRPNIGHISLAIYIESGVWDQAVIIIEIFYCPRSVLCRERSSMTQELRKVGQIISPRITNPSVTSKSNHMV